MLKFRKLLLIDNIYRVIFILVFIYALLITNIPKYKSVYNINNDTFKCTLNDSFVTNEKATLELKCKENIIGNYYINNKYEKKFFDSLEIGSLLEIKGELTKPQNNTIPYAFNYKKYLYNKKIYYLLNIDNVKVIKRSNNIFYKIKNYVYKRVKKQKHNEYIYAFILGKTDYIDSSVLSSYRTNGISHLFALSGLHISIFSLILKKILDKLKVGEIYTYIIIFLFLLLFSFISGFSPSILRATLLFFLLGINKTFYFYIKTINILYLVFIILVLLNPFIIYNISFILSFISTFFLILNTDRINSKSYIKSLLQVSALAFISNIGVSLYYFNYINPLGIIYNLLFVPYVSFIVFPFSILVFIFPFLNNIFNLLIILMESISLKLSNINLVIYFPHINLFIVYLYYLFLIISFKVNKKGIIFLIIILFYSYIKPYLITYTRVYYLDVSQGDSILIVTKHLNSVILIDTGGIVGSTYKIYEEKLIPLFRNLGIKKINYLVLTHGDYDHIGEANGLIKNFKVNNIVFNNGDFNDLEKEVIKTAKEKNIPYFNNINKININESTLYFLNDKEFDNENDNSSVIYLKIDNKKFLFMGDASTKTESYLLDTYSLENIDILKVGHHGSKTSSSTEFLSEIKPSVSIISSGLNNKFGHPHKEVVDSLKLYGKVYNTAYDGTIQINIKNKENIVTYKRY